MKAVGSSGSVGSSPRGRPVGTGTLFGPKGVIFALVMVLVCQQLVNLHRVGLQFHANNERILAQELQQIVVGQGSRTFQLGNSDAGVWFENVEGACINLAVVVTTACEVEKHCGYREELLGFVDNIIGLTHRCIRLHFIYERDGKDSMRETVAAIYELLGRKRIDLHQLSIRKHYIPGESESTAAAEAYRALVGACQCDKAASRRKKAVPCDLYLIKPVLHLILEGVDSVIVLDIDLYFRADLSELWQLFDEFDSQQMIGLARELQPSYLPRLPSYVDNAKKHKLIVSPPPQDMQYGESVEFGPTFLGFNGGVQLLNLTRMRQSEVYASSISYSAVANMLKYWKGHRCYYGDQCFYTMLAILHWDLFFPLDCRWNRQLCGGVAATMNISRTFADRLFSCPSEASVGVAIYHGNCRNVLWWPPYEHVCLSRDTVQDLSLEVAKRFSTGDTNVYRRNINYWRKVCNQTVTDSEAKMIRNDYRQYLNEMGFAGEKAPLDDASVLMQIREQLSLQSAVEGSVVGEHDGDVMVLVGILSAPDRLVYRQAQRDSWLKNLRCYTTEGASRICWEYVFLIGRPTSGVSRDSLELELRQEEALNNDVLLLDVVDTVAGLDLKIEAFFHRLANDTARPDLVLKTDDDCYLDLDRITRMLLGLPLFGVYAGHFVKKLKQYPSDHKWHIAEADYEKLKRVSYMRGEGYLLSMDLVSFISQRVLGQAWRRPFTGAGMEDVLVGYALNPIAEHLVWVDLSEVIDGIDVKCDARSVVVHHVDESDMLKIHWAVTKERDYCSGSTGLCTTNRCKASQAHKELATLAMDGRADSESLAYTISSYLCEDTCGELASSNRCNDGGPGSTADGCKLGTNCQMCGPRILEDPTPKRLVVPASTVSTDMLDDLLHVSDKQQAEERVAMSRHPSEGFMRSNPAQLDLLWARDAEDMLIVASLYTISRHSVACAALIMREMIHAEVQCHLKISEGGAARYLKGVASVDLARDSHGSPYEEAVVTCTWGADLCDFGPQGSEIELELELELSGSSGMPPIALQACSPSIAGAPLGDEKPSLALCMSQLYWGETSRGNGHVEPAHEIDPRVLIEWLEYNFMMGVQHVYIYASDCQDLGRNTSKLLEVIHEYQSRRMVTLVRFCDIVDFPAGVTLRGQTSAMHDCLLRSKSINGKDSRVGRHSYLLFADLDEFIVTFDGEGRVRKDWSDLLAWWQEEGQNSRDIAAVTFASMRFSPFHCASSSTSLQSDPSLIVSRLTTRSSVGHCLEELTSANGTELSPPSIDEPKDSTALVTDAQSFFRKGARSICVGPIAHQKYIAKVDATHSLNIHEPMRVDGEIVHLGLSRGRVNHYSDGLSIANADAICSWTHAASGAPLAQARRWRSTVNVCSGGLVRAKSGKMRPAACEKEKRESTVDEGSRAVYTTLGLRIVNDSAVHALYNSM